MRWLLAKDLRILRRSPLLVALLVLYPVGVGLLIGLSLSSGPEKPRIAFLNEVPEGESFRIGSQEFDLGIARAELFKRIDPIEVSSRREAERLVRDGDVLGALVIPANTVQKLESGLEQPRLEVLVNEEDPLKARLVDDAIASALAEANQRVSRALTKTSLEYLGLLLRGGSVNVLGREFTVLGLQRIGEIIEVARRRLPAGSRERRELEEVLRFNRLAQQNFGLTSKALASISQPIRVEKQVLNGERVPLTTFAAAIAVAISLMFVTVLLASASLALEREDNTFGRLVRGPVTRTGLLAEKVALAAIGALPVALLLLLVLAGFVPLEWGRVELWLVTLVAAAVAFGALGALIGALAREVAAASLLAFTLLLPIAFLALVPEGAVGNALYDVTRAVSALFPFKPAVDALTSALYGEGSALGPLLHLAALAAGFGLVARLALRRLG